MMGPTRSFMILFLPLVSANVAAWHKGMYCLNGTKAGVDDESNSAPVQPLFNLKRSDWWMQAKSQCINFPPADGDFLDLCAPHTLVKNKGLSSLFQPANGEFTVELATNRVFTSLSNSGARATTFAGPLADGVTDDTFGVCGGSTGKACDCITQPNIHTQNETSAAGTAFAIAYNPVPMDVKPEELVVFTIAEHTPWRRLTTYQVPNLPKCPDAGCTCAWGWVPNGCGEPDIYMQPFRCRVTGTPGNVSLAPAKPPVFCKANPSSCTSGSKQMIFWNQADGNNVDFQDPANLVSPGYNSLMGWTAGRQTDIFTDSPQTSGSGGNANSDKADPSKSISAGAIAGIIVGVVALLAMIVVFLFCRRRRSPKSSEEAQEAKEAENGGQDLTVEPFMSANATDTTGPSFSDGQGRSIFSAHPPTSSLGVSTPYHRKTSSNTTGITGSSVEPPSSSDATTSTSDRRQVSKLQQEIHRLRELNQQTELALNLPTSVPLEQEEESITPERHATAVL